MRCVRPPRRASERIGSLQPLATWSVGHRRSISVRGHLTSPNGDGGAGEGRRACLATCLSLSRSGCMADWLRASPRILRGYALKLVPHQASLPRAADASCVHDETLLWPCERRGAIHPAAALAPSG